MKTFSEENPSDYTPFSMEHKIKTILKIRTSFTELECQILNTYISSGRKRDYTLDFYGISRANLYRLLKRVDNLFESQKRDQSEDS